MKRYKFDFKSPAKMITFNHCSVLIEKDVYSRNNVPVFTIERYQKKDVNPKLILEFIQPEISAPINHEQIEFKPDIIIFQPYARLHIIAKNNLALVSIYNSKGKLIERKIQRKGTQKGKALGQLQSNQKNVKVIFDKANMRIKLTGPKTCPDWVKIENI